MAANGNDARLSARYAALGLRPTPALLGVEIGPDGWLRAVVEAPGGRQTVIKACSILDKGLAQLDSRDLRWLAHELVQVRS